MPDLLRLARAARALLPPGAGLGWADPARLWPLLPGEDPGQGAVPRRRAEFSAGRHAARMALAELGLPPMALPMAPDRAPVWPDGVTGSLSHTPTACLAVAVQGLAGLGLDLEEDAPLDPALWPQVLRPPEADWALRQPDPGRAALQLFCAKEAAYKAQYPLSRRLLGFDALEITVDGPRFAARFTAETPPFATGHRLHGLLTRSEGHVLAVALAPILP